MSERHRHCIPAPPAVAARTPLSRDAHLIPVEAVRNPCVGAMIEAVRDRTRTVELKQVNAVLLQPHWRNNQEGKSARPVMLTNRKPVRAQPAGSQYFGETEAGPAGKQPAEG